MSAVYDNVTAALGDVDSIMVCVCMCVYVSLWCRWCGSLLVPLSNNHVADG